MSAAQNCAEANREDENHGRGGGGGTGNDRRDQYPQNATYQSRQREPTTRSEDRGGDRDGGGRRDDREDRGDRGEEADRWTRVPPRQEQPLLVAPPPPRSSSLRPSPITDRPSHNRRVDARDGRGDDAALAVAASTVTTTTRPIIKIQPRTLPMETVGQPPVAAAGRSPL